MKKLRTTTAVLFLLAGGVKLFALPGFATVLRTCGVPAPALAALAVPLLEIGGGGALLAGRRPRLAALALAIDMVFAIVLVGIPGARGVRFHADGHTVGGEAWRLPLELALLLTLLVLASRGDAPQSKSQSK